MSGHSLVAGVDLSGTNLQFGLVDPSGGIVSRSRGKTEADRGLEHVVANVARGIREVCDAAGVGPGDLEAVGVAAAGAIDIPRGVIIEAPNLGWIDVPLRDILAAAVGCPVVLDNDVNGATWGEYRLGAGRGSVDALGIWVGTGVGGGLILNERVYHGRFFTAGEIGHTVVDPHGEPGRRTIEDICSRKAVQHALGASLDTDAIAEAYHGGDPAVTGVVNHGARLLGIAIANWVTVLSLDTVILGGGITESLGSPYVAAIRASFDETVFPDRCRGCRLLTTTLAADAGLLGAALLARQATGG